jgi:hypothetical protein
MSISSVISIRKKGVVTISVEIEIEESTIRERLQEANEDRDREDRIKISTVWERVEDGSALTDIIENLLDEGDLIEAILEG